MAREHANFTKHRFEETPCADIQRRSDLAERQVASLEAIAFSLQLLAFIAGVGLVLSILSTWS